MATAERKTGVEILTYVASTAAITYAMLDQLGFFERHPLKPAVLLGTARAAYRLASVFGDLGLWAEHAYYREVRP